ncbi:CBL-interacting serine/threonine-protein kinase 1-like isoform X3 [Mangifera indica]|uniref:CBL-interacting serine/threonine-protein kinase 1-like isoform X3 n=1 Tax=Mangifera indica TaxID=29780 RepID=UPI001CFC2E32|nr:CBL-interacting serine/threonine-protein kinase 1-like isoform X3 [Mangifera indica]
MVLNKLTVREEDDSKKNNTTTTKLGMQLGNYELGRTLGEGNFGKVKLAKKLDSGQAFAVKILEKNRIIDLKITDQIKREIATLKLLKHPNVIRLHEVLASKSKIYMVLEYVTGGELFDRIASKRRLPEAEGRKLFQQLIDGISYCHNKGVFHRDLKLENILVDSNRNIKISDFGLSALPQHFRDDGLLHTTCGSPNYVAPEVLANRGYDGATSDIWSCGIILYVILTGYLPFDDRNLAVLYQKKFQIFKGDTKIPEWLSPGAQNMLRRILEPNPIKRITMSDIKADEWFKQDYTPEDLNDKDEDIFVDDEAFSMQEVNPGLPTLINAFQLIGMSSYLDLSGFFEKEDVSERKIRFTSNRSAKDLIERIEDIVTEMGFRVQKKNVKLECLCIQLKATLEHRAQKSSGSLSVAAEVFEISPSLYVVELRKSYGDTLTYRQLCKKLSSDLKEPPSQELLTT